MSMSLTKKLLALQRLEKLKENGECSEYYFDREKKSIIGERQATNFSGFASPKNLNRDGVFSRLENVEALWCSGKDSAYPGWYNAQVMGYNETDGTYHLAFSDGGVDTNVAPKDIRRRINRIGHNPLDTPLNEVHLSKKTKNIQIDIDVYDNFVIRSSVVPFSSKKRKHKSETFPPNHNGRSTESEFTTRNKSSKNSEKMKAAIHSKNIAQSKRKCKRIPPKRRKTALRPCRYTRTTTDVDHKITMKISTNTTANKILKNRRDHGSSRKVGNHQSAIKNELVNTTKFPLLSTISTEKWLHSCVLITGGRHLGMTATVSGAQHGWVLLIPHDKSITEQVAKRAKDLVVIPLHLAKDSGKLKDNNELASQKNMEAQSVLSNNNSKDSTGRKLIGKTNSRNSTNTKNTRNTRKQQNKSGNNRKLGKDEFAVQQRVEAAFDKGKYGFFVGTIIQKNNDNTYDILYDDGDFETKVTKNYIRGISK